MNGMPSCRYARWLLLALILSCGIALADQNPTKQSDPEYRPVPEAIAALQAVDRPTEIVLFHGAWCKDCQREVPRFMRILELVGNDHLVLTEYEVTPEKKDALGKFEEYGIQRVPTFIVIRSGRELGRIVERPEKSLEEDLVTILQGQE